MAGALRGRSAGRGAGAAVAVLHHRRDHDPDDECRYLLKLLWLGIVVLLGTIGSLAWLLMGRPWASGSPVQRAPGGQ